MHAILGAGGAIGTELVKALAQRRQPVRVVGRNPTLTRGATEAVAADVSSLDQALRAIDGAEIVYLLVGLKYDTRVWAELWPRIMDNAIEACKRVRAKLVFFDNVYMYGKVDGPMTEDTPFNPCSEKGEIRARIATTLLNEIAAGSLQGMIARSADFYGPRARNSVFNILVFDKFARGKTAAWLVNDAVPHSFTFTPDAGRGLALLAHTDSAWNQTWHLPTAADPPSGREFIPMVARALGREPNHRILSRPMIRLAGLFSTTIRESYEMLYQNDSAYLFDSTKFRKAFGLEPTAYADGIRLTADACRAMAE